MREVVKNLYVNYNMTNKDWLCYEIYNLNNLTGHHIMKSEWGFKLTYNNTAVLNDYDHHYLHCIENYDRERYMYLNLILKCINAQGHMPTRKQIIMIDECLKSFEREYSGKRSRKGNEIILPEYTRRLIK